MMLELPVVARSRGEGSLSGMPLYERRQHNEEVPV
jgi:hypothetical protein